MKEDISRGVRIVQLSSLDHPVKSLQDASREPSPNRGHSVPDIQAISPNRESISAWQARKGIDPSQQIRLIKLAHMRYQHPDLAQITTFLRGSSLLHFTILGIRTVELIASRF
jgi:hypothetical protein